MLNELNNIQTYFNELWKMIGNHFEEMLDSRCRDMKPFRKFSINSRNFNRRNTCNINCMTSFCCTNKLAIQNLKRNVV